MGTGEAQPGAGVSVVLLTSGEGGRVAGDGVNENSADDGRKKVLPGEV